MGLIRLGILGGFRKKTGTVVGAQWRSLDVIRALPRPSGKPPTQLQIDQQLKFGLVTALLSEIGDLIDVGYYSPSDIATPMNKAVARHLKNAITGVSPDFTIDPPKLKYSEGNLKLPEFIAAEGTSPNEVTFTWHSISMVGAHISSSDKATFLVYNPAKEMFISAVDVVERGTEEYVMELPVEFAGDTVHTYLSFTSETVKTKRSDSKFVSTVVLPI